MSETVINTVIIAVPLDLAKLPTLSMYYHTCRIDNGFGSRRSLLADTPLSEAPSEVHSITFPVLQFHHLQLSVPVPAIYYSSSTDCPILF